MKTLGRILTTCILLGLAVSTQAVPMQRDAGSGPMQSLSGEDAPGLATFQGGGKTLAQAVEQVRRQYGGRIVSAETVRNGGRETHIIKVLTDDGKVKTVRVPGRKL